MPSKRKKTAQEKRKKTRGRRKVKSGDCCVTIKPKTSKFCYLCILKPGKLKFCFWKRLAFWAVLALYGETVTGLASESFFKQNSPERMV